MIDMVLNELQSTSIATEQSKVRIGMRVGRGRMEDEPRAVVSESRESGIFIHRCVALKI